MYIGETVEASPTPMPPMNRQAINWYLSGAAMQPIVDTTNSNVAKSRVRFLPSVSASHTPASGPNGQPKIALPRHGPIPKGIQRKLLFQKEDGAGNQREIVAEQETAHGRNQNDPI